MAVWMACGLMTFGYMLTLYRGFHPDIRKDVAATFAVHVTALGSWLMALNSVRNVCAHHGRLWNRELGTKPMMSKKDQAWHQPVRIANDRMFGILSICKHCLNRVASQTRWPSQLRELLGVYPYVPRGSMGIPSNWESSVIWALPKHPPLRLCKGGNTTARDA